MIRNVTCLFFLCLWFGIGRAQTTRADNGILQTYSAKSEALKFSADSITQYLVKFKTQPDWRTAKLYLVKRLSADYYIVSSTVKLNAGNNLINAVPASPLWKATNELAQQIADHPNNSKQITIALKAPTTSALNKIKQLATVIAVNANTATIKVQLKQLAVLLADSNVVFATPVRKAHTELSIDNIDLGVNQISAIADQFPGINGSGINASVKEESYNEADLDLLGRSFVAAPKSPIVSGGHADIMATLLGGNGNSFIKGLGAAPAVRLTSSDFARLLPDSTPYFTNFSISVQNHSYGTGIENYYGIEAVAYDKQLYEQDTLVHVFSSGNIGTTAPSTGLYSGMANMANLSGTFKQAKNVLVIGGTGRTNLPEPLSSAGPAYDGRVKPELVVEGEDGTSGAAALTSGTVALLQQAYKKQYGKLPSSALVKSVLINSADDIGIPAVDFKTGYGKLNALEAIRTISEGRFKTGVLNDKLQQTYQVNVPANCSMLKISLAWNDVPANLHAPYALINNLDLAIKTPAGETLLPWVLSSYPSIDSLSKPATRQRDTLNNAEQITLTNPPAGAYTIVVSGARLSTAQQAFYVAYQTRQANSFEWTFPSGNSQLFANDDNYLRWENTYNAAAGQLSVSYDNGANWQPVENANLSGGFYKWVPPTAFTQARLNITVNGKDYLSKAFTISKPLTLNVGYDCTDGTLLHWNRQPGATGYVIYSIKDNILQKLTTTTDTIIVIPATMQTSKFFAVSAQGNGFEGLRSFTIDATTQGVGCYVRTLLANVTNAGTVQLSLSLGSVLNLNTITWEKLTGVNTYTALDVISTGIELDYQFTDHNPKKGLNYYRATLGTDDGKSINSDLASAVLLQGNQFTIYPNPVSTQLNILAGELNTYEFKVYDMMGLLRLSKTFNGLQNTIPISLMPGTYICIIGLNGKTLFKSKIVKF